ncbi:MAG: hypothetical protein E7525_01765 [Ruminococcaceae bacterium]|nr:hypothetical protein [Oscillospiraceae bacterium]
MKKLLVIATVLTLILSVCACKNDEATSNSDVTANTESTASTASTVSNTTSEVTPSSDTQNTSSEASSVSSDATVSKPIHVHNFSEATCKSPAKCSCGKTQGEPLEHIFTEAVCILCGYQSVNSNASHGNYETIISNKDGTVSKLTIFFYHDTESVMMTGMKYSPEIPADANRHTPVIDYNGKRYYYFSTLTIGEGIGYNLVITDTTVEFDSDDQKHHFVLEFTGDSFIIKSSTSPDHPVGTELKTTKKS